MIGLVMAWVERRRAAKAAEFERRRWEAWEGVPQILKRYELPKSPPLDERYYPDPRPVRVPEAPTDLYGYRGGA